MSTVSSPAGPVASPTPTEPTPSRAWGPSAAVLAAVVALLALGGLTADDFLTSDNALVVVRAAAVTGIVALGATFITLSGNFFSLALAQTAIFCSVLFALMMRGGFGLVPSLVLVIAAAVMIGALQGGVVAAGANPIVTTLGAGALLFGFAGLITNSKNIRLETDAAQWLGSGRPLGIPTQTWTFVLLIGLSWFVLRRTRLGRAVVLTGANRAAAASSGLRVGAVTVAAFVIASIGAAIVGVFGAAEFDQAKLNQFERLDLDVVAAVLIGGSAVAGGEGSTLRTALGAIFIALLQNYMLIRGWPQGTRIVVLGVLVIVAASAFHLLRRRGGAGT